MIFEPSLAHTDKGMSPRLVLMILNRHHQCPLIFPRRFERIRAGIVLRNYEFMTILGKSSLLYPLARKRDERLDHLNNLEMFSDDLSEE